MSTAATKKQALYGKPGQLTNIITHALGAALSFVGLVFLMLKCAANGLSAFSVTAVFAYGFLTTAVFGASAVYHVISPTREHNVLKKIDSIAIPVLILAVYAPITLVGLSRGDAADKAWGIAVLSIIAVMTVLSAVFSDKFEYKVVSLVIYVIIGWACLIRIDRVAALIGSCFWFLVGGLIMYAGGIVFNAVKKIPFGHTVFHILTAVGAALHFVCVYIYLL